MPGIFSGLFFALGGLFFLFSKVFYGVAEILDDWGEPSLGTVLKGLGLTWVLVGIIRQVAGFGAPWEPGFFWL